MKALVALLACALSPLTSMTASAQEAPALAAIKDAVEKSRVRALIEGARKEGALSWIGVQFDPARAEKIIDEFKRYHGLDNFQVQYSYTPTGEIITRVDQLLREKKNTIDVVWSSSPAWYKELLGRGEIMKYVSPYYREYTLSDKFGLSEPGYWVSDAYTFVPLYSVAAMEQRGIAQFNPVGWADFVDPKLAGHISMIDPMVSASVAPMLAGIVKTMGDGWLRKLGANRPALHVRGADGREAVGAGKYAATLFGTPADALSLIERNIAAKQVFPKEGVILVPFTPIILASAPNPNSARLFIDFVRSSYGTQVALAKNAGALIFFGRPGVTTNYPELLPAMEDVKAIPFDWDREASNEAIAAFRSKARATGIGSR